MKKFLLLFLTLTCAAVAQVKIDVGDVDWPSQSANAVFAGPAAGSPAAPAFRGLTQADVQAATAALRNGLSPRGGVALDGTGYVSRSGVDLGLSGEKSVSIVAVFEVSATAATRQIVQKPNVAQGYSTFRLDLNASHQIVFAVEASPNYPSWRTNRALVPGKTYVVAASWSNTSGTASDAVIYVDGMAETSVFTANGYSPAFVLSENSNFLNIGVARDITAGQWTRHFSGRISSVSIYNLALTAADVQEIYELGGAVPERFKFGSQADRITENDQTFASGFGSWSSKGGGAVVVSSSAGKLVVTATALATNNVAGTSVSGATLTGGRVYRHSFKHRLASGSVSLLRVGGDLRHFNPFEAVREGAHTFTASATEATLTIVGTAKLLGDALIVGKDSTSPESFVLELDDYRVVQLGALIHLPFIDGVGFQVRDDSTNRLHAERTTAGTSWVHPLRGGRQTLTYTFAHSAISSTAATTTAFVLPPNTVLREVQLNRTAAFDASTTLDVGISGTPTKFVSAAGVAGTGFTQVASSSLVPESASAATTVYVKKNQSTTTGSVTLNFIIEAVGSPTQ